MLTRTATRTGLTSALSPWRRPGAVHDPAKVLLDMAVSVAAGGDCLAGCPHTTTNAITTHHEHHTMPHQDHEQSRLMLRLDCRTASTKGSPSTGVIREMGLSM